MKPFRSVISRGERACERPKIHNYPRELTGIREVGPDMLLSAHLYPGKIHLKEIDIGRRYITQTPAESSGNDGNGLSYMSTVRQAPNSRGERSL